MQGKTVVKVFLLITAMDGFSGCMKISGARRFPVFLKNCEEFDV